MPPKTLEGKMYRHIMLAHLHGIGYNVSRVFSPYHGKRYFKRMMDAHNNEAAKIAIQLEKNK
ncbi:hypothetical protein IIC68_01175 [archaeon]|nr:hypothetical protein [archaeon]